MINNIIKNIGMEKARFYENEINNDTLQRIFKRKLIFPKRFIEIKNRKEKLIIEDDLLRKEFEFKMKINLQ
ncbi:MAG: hypothetical protein ACTSPI_01425 [Candidatus Heimdallarchaeaceae archaeon]